MERQLSFGCDYISNDDDDIIIKARPLSLNTSFELEVGKELILNSLNSINDYIKFMIGFNGVLAGIYSGLLPFFPKEAIQNIPSIVLFLPVVAFISSAAMFTIAFFPQMEKISLNKPATITETYHKLIASKTKDAKIGTYLFFLSILILSTILVIL